MVNSPAASKEALGPLASFHPCFQGGYHAVCPDRRFDPTPPISSPGRGLFALYSRLRHCRRSSFLLPSHPASTFLRPFAPPALPRFIAPTDALTPRPGHPQVEVSLILVLSHHDHSVANHPMDPPASPWHTFSHRRAGSPALTPVSASPLASRLADPPGRIAFVILRTGHSPSAALHPTSR
jgi:hypothetical protein